MKNSRPKDNSESNTYYLALLDMKGDGYAVRAKKDLLRVRLLGALFFAIGITIYFCVEGLFGHLALALSFSVIGACGAIDGGIRKRKHVWPYLDQVVDWPKVEAKSRKAE